MGIMNFSGVPTLTTPTLTPTTLRTIEQSLNATLHSTLMSTSPPSYASGSFIPPTLPQQQTQGGHPLAAPSFWNGGGRVAADEDLMDLKPVEEQPPPPTTKPKRGGRRTAGGRRPAPTSKSMTPEEEDRRRMRRERNKMAAARCRKRRVDHTNMLQEETESLESTKRSLSTLITDLQHEKDDLEMILQAHVVNCRSTSTTKLKRPTSLPVGTPGSVFDFDWTNFPSTGLTPGVGALTPLMTPGTVGAILGLVKGEPASPAAAGGDMAIL